MELVSYEGFMALVRGVFDHSLEGREGISSYSNFGRMARLRRSTRSDFALCTLFRRQLQEIVQTELARRDNNLTFNSFIMMAMHLDNLIQACWPPHRLSPSFVDCSE